MSVRIITKLELKAFETLEQSDLVRPYIVVAGTIQFVPTRKIAEIQSDQHEGNILDEWDGWLGSMACWHNRYNLGHEQPDVNPSEFHIELIEEVNPGFGDRLERRSDAFYLSLAGSSHLGNLKSLDEFVDGIVDRELAKHYVTLPLYLYDHGGITISTGPFGCPWDSGQVGFIYASHKQIRDHFGWKRLNKSRIERAYEVLKGEVETYDTFLRGDVWGFVVKKEAFNPLDEEWVTVEEDVDSCWGFYGHLGDPRLNGMDDCLEDDVNVAHNAVFDEFYDLAEHRAA